MRFWRCNDYPCDRSKRQSRTLHLETELVGLGEEIVILLVREVRIDRNRAVEENLELSRAGIEIRRGSEHNHVSLLHLLENRRRIILDDTLVRLLTGVATRAVADLLVGDAYLRDLVTRTALAAAVAVGYAQSIFLRALRELVAKETGVAALAHITRT